MIGETIQNGALGRQHASDISHKPSSGYQYSLPGPQSAS